VEDIFNLEKALKRTMGDRELLSELVDFTLQDIPGQIGQIEDLLERGDSFQLKESAHKLKGSAGAICADRLFLACFDLEQLAAGGNLIDAATVLVKVKAEAEELIRHREITELRP